MKCSVCGQKELFPGKVNYIYNKKPICSICLNAHIVKCDICGRIKRDVKWHTVELDGRSYTVCPDCEGEIEKCQECHEHIHSKINRWGFTSFCNKCGPYETFRDYITKEYWPLYDMKEVMDGPFKVKVSISTFSNSKYFKVCSFCKEKTIRRVGDPLEDEEFICAKCAPNVRTCALCGDKFLKMDHNRFHFDSEDQYITEHENQTLEEAQSYCSSCSGSAVRRYHANHSEMLQFFYVEDKKSKSFEVPFGSTGDRKDLFMGFELEVDGMESVPREQVRACAVRVMEELGPDLISITEDGSLHNGFEIISAPATLEWYEKAWDQTYRKMCNIIRRYGLRSHDPGTCGLHVHVSRNAIRDLNSLSLFFHWFIPEFVVFSRRRRMGYCAPSGWGGYLMDCTFDRFLNWTPVSLGHAVAFNTQNNTTAEFRIFRGTINQQTLLATLQLIDGFVKYVNLHTESELPSIKWEDILKSIPGEALKAYASTLYFHKYDSLFVRNSERFKTFDIVSYISDMADMKETL